MFMYVHRSMAKTINSRAPRQEQRGKKVYKNKWKILNLCDDEWRIWDGKRLHIVYFSLYERKNRPKNCRRARAKKGKRKEENEHNIIPFGSYTLRDVYAACTCRDGTRARLSVCVQRLLYSYYTLCKGDVYSYTKCVYSYMCVYILL